MTPIAEELIRRLRHDPETRGGFKITSWESPNVCGTVRCIAGMAVHLARDPSRTAERQTLRYFDEMDISEHRKYIAAGAKLLGIPFVRTARDLFMPWEARDHLLSSWEAFVNSPESLDFPEQARPDLSTVRKMKQWAQDMKAIPVSSAWEYFITPDRAAYALERITKDEIPYCNWAEAFENA